MNKQSGSSRKWLLTTVSLAALVFVSLSGSVQSYGPSLPPDEEPFQTISLPQEALLSAAIPAETRSTERNPKLDSVLVELAAAARVSGKSAADLAQARNLRLSNDRVHVQILTDDALLSRAVVRMKAAGGEVTGVGSNSTLIQGWLPVQALESVASDAAVYRIRPPLEPVLLENLTAGSYTTEGLEAINGTVWHSAGFDGTGVKVGIIDAGFLGYPGLLGSELPASVVVRNFVDGETDGQVNGDTEHGTAVAEIVYDIAPGAALYLVKIGTNLDLQEAVAWLKDTIGVDIISTSLGWYNLTPGDGTGEFQDLVLSARDAGILWTTAAGNDREAHWGGAFSDPDVNDYHNFNGVQEINFFGPGGNYIYPIPPGYTIRVALRWDDWTNVDQDYDLYLYRYDLNTKSWEQVASSYDSQTGFSWQTPTEYLEYFTIDDNSGYGFKIERWASNRNVNLEVFAPKITRLDELVHARSLSNLADAPAAFTVAALDVTPPYLQEDYSSEGPANGPGGTDAASGFNKPDISGFANVSTASYGTGNFNGTSSATPHVAGAAALVLSAYPAYTPDQLQDYLQANAVDMGTAGMDTVYGFGRLYLGDPPDVTGPIISSISPNTGSHDGVVHVTISGENISGGAAVKLTRAGQADINGSNVEVPGSTTITADLDLTGAAAGLWSVVVTNPDTKFGQLTNGFTITGDSYSVFLPLIMKNFPATPTTPFLNAISNPDNNGAYTVSWSASENADGYTLQEDTNAAFTDPTEIFSGSELSFGVSGRDLGTYYYRVKAWNAYRESGWSNTRQVTVSVVPQPGEWEIVSIPGDSTQGEYSSIALDSSGYPNISFMKGLNIQYARWNGSGWESVTTDTLDVYSFPGTSLALDAANQPWIAYLYNNPCYLGLLEWGGSVPNHRYFDIGTCANYAEISLKVDDEPCISYFVRIWNDSIFTFDYDIKLVCRTAGEWPDYPTNIARYANYATTLFELARFHSFTLDSQDRPHLSFTRGLGSESHELRYNGPDQDASSSVTVDASPNVGFYSSLALDSQERPHISYYDKANGDLKYAWLDGSTWQVETVDSNGDVGRFTSLALDASDRPHISYYDHGAGDLKYANWDGEQWLIDTIDSTGDVGRTTSLALDENDYVHISYYDVTSGRLKYATTSGILSP